MEKEELVYALLDGQSDACFIRDDVVKRLAVRGPNVQLKLSTVLGENVVTCQKVSGLVVRGFREELDVSLPGTYSREDIPVKRSQIPKPESVLGWPHLERIADRRMPYRGNVDVSLLIGSNCARDQAKGGHSRF